MTFYRIALLVLSASSGVNATWEQDASGHQYYTIRVEQVLMQPLASGQAIVANVNHKDRKRLNRFRILVGGQDSRELATNEDRLKSDPTSHGWRLGHDGGIDYMIQLSPEQLEALANGTPMAGEIESEVTDIRRMFVFVGSSTLPRVMNRDDLAGTRFRKHPQESQRPSVPTTALPAEQPASRTGAEAAQVYQIEMRLVERGPDGQMRTLSQPVLTTIEGQPVSFSLESQVPLPESAKTKSTLPAGTSCHLEVYRNKGKLLLDATYNVGVTQDSESNRARIATRTLRLVEEITLGKQISVLVSDGDTKGDHGRFELVVTELSGPSKTVVRHLDPVTLTAPEGDRLANASALAVQNLAFCKNVNSYGRYEKLRPYTFEPGQEVLLYGELENFVSKTARGRYETELQGEYAIVDADGNKVESRGLPLDKQVSTQRLRDYFIAYRLFLPKKLSAGEYTLVLTIKDVNGEKSNQGSIEFRSD